MSLLLKIMSSEDAPDEDSRKTFCLYTDITSCHFRRNPDGTAEAHVWCREPIKTALVPGFVEIEKHIVLTGNAYLMNEAGKTVSSFGVARWEDGSRTGPSGRKIIDSKLPDETITPSVKGNKLDIAGNLILIDGDRLRVIDALDTLGLALVGHSHQWTKDERRAYTRATSLLAADKKRPHPMARVTEAPHSGQPPVDLKLTIHTPDAESFRAVAEGSRRTLHCAAFPNRGK